MIVNYRTLTVAMLALIAASPPKLANAQAQLQGFKMPSKNIYCMFEPAVVGSEASDLRCDIMQTTSRPPPRPASCRFSWGHSFEVDQNGNSGIRNCVGDTTRDDDLPVLNYGAIWTYGGFSCLSATGGLACTNAKGHGFMLSKEEQKLF